MHILNNNFILLLALPLTKELQVFQTPDGFDVQWSTYTSTRINIKTADTTVFIGLSNHINTISLYQREPFMQGSATHQWIWFYEQGIPPELRIVPEDVERSFRNRVTVQLQPQHYGREAIETYVKQQLKKRESEYIRSIDICVRICTWNVAGLPPRDSITPLLLGATQGYVFSETPPDLLIVALQEIVPLNAKNILGDENRKNEWLEFVLSQANLTYPSSAYRVIASPYLVGLLLVVLSSSALAGSIDKTKEISVKVGLRGYAGNKGAVCARFELLNSSFCFVNCHLAAHKGNVRVRNKNIQSILQEASFAIDRDIRKIYEHDLIFWTGDMNYRISTLRSKEILQRIHTESFEELTEYDQLIRARAENGVLVDFFEGPLNFPPTFKVLKGSCDYK